MADPGPDPAPTGEPSHPADQAAPTCPPGALLPARRRAAAARRLTRHYPGGRALRLVIGLALLIVAGTGLLWLPVSSTGRPLRLDEAFFTAVSALSTTGLSVVAPGRDLSLFGQVVLLVLMQVGGLGFMLSAIVIFRLLGRRIDLEERLALRDSLGLVSTRALLRLVRLVVGGGLLIEGAGAAFLWLNWQPLLGPQRAAYYAVFHSVSAFSNTSFDLFSGAPDAPAAFPTDPATLLTLCFLIIMGSLGIPALADLARWPRRRSLSLYGRLTLVTVAALLVLGTIVLFVAESRPDAMWAGQAWPRRLLLAFFHSTASRTSGFVLQPLGSMAPASALTLIWLMFVGGSPASMSGGITTSTLAVLVLATWNYVRGRSTVTVAGRSIPTETVLKALAILTISLLVVGVTASLLLLTQETTLTEGLFEAVSAFSTAGFTLGLTSRLTLFGRLLMAGAMFWGRLGPLTVVVALARREQPRRVAYPEEQILIG